MRDYHLSPAEKSFADVIWANAPLESSEMVRLGEEHFGWKRTTTYTVLKHLCGKNIFSLERGTVRALISREDFYAGQSVEYVQQSFGGDLPAFLAAFTSKEKLKEEDICRLEQLIGEYRKEQA